MTFIAYERSVLRKTALSATMALAVLTGLTAAATAETIRLGNEGTYPPFSMVNAAGDLVGLEPDLARAMCERMGVDCEIQVMTFKALVPSMLQGKFDVLISQITPTAERKEKMLFSRRIIANPMVFLVPTDFDAPMTQEGLAGKGMKLALQSGGAHIKMAKDMFGDSVEYVLYDNPDQFHLDMQAGRVNMSFEAKLNAEVEFLSKDAGKGFKITEGEYWIGEPDVPENERGLAWAVRKDDPELVKRMDAALESLIADCTYTEIRKKYLEINTLPEDAACESKVN
ncbi:Lysine-arginine-ornithine-binding periplasmic protein precursor [Hartmannibacter diazotrophicus]|uniref:Lysine-arginine-ornithine-binding periplasmic protein n=1 Tax=Hartmannibacter diazotrophicus TaxID=1482074 RepID=A0A2C9D7E6_9HYPH|nr:transporter substrate-binding domain-containing protein [Hartmannibacter diazotrophicus]SON55671.1 Lysine-arginine-ornithine-binding periplasmic protein precursor [Hartmannibacter diazotrophicus]